jgi:hypothetical protein
MALVNSAISESRRDTINIYIDSLIKHTNLANQVASDLSIRISALSSGIIHGGDTIKKDSVYLAKIFLCIRPAADSLKLKLAEPYRSDFSINFSNLKTQYGLMNKKIYDLISDPGDPVYAAQIDYTENSITSFISTLTNFRQYLLSLKPLKADDMFAKIRKRLDTTDANVDSNACELMNSISDVKDKTDKIIKLLTPDTIARHYLVFSAYADAVFGLSYLMPVGKITDGARNCIGAEFLMPFDRSNAQSPGGFVLYGLRYDKLLLEAGAGYFKTTQTPENVSWKCGITYTAHKIGLGVEYSPLTKAGMMVSYRW